MKGHPILTEPTTDRRVEFLTAVARSRKLHRHWARPPKNAKEFKDYLTRLKRDPQIGYWVCTEDGKLARVVNINEIVRSVFCSGYLGYYAFVPHNGHGHMKKGLSAALAEAFRRLGLYRLKANIQPENEVSRQLVQRCGFNLEDSHRDILSWPDADEIMKDGQSQSKIGEHIVGCKKA